MGKNRTPVSVLAAAALTLTLVSCSGDKPSPDDAAAALAQGLSEMDLSASVFTEGDASEVNAELEQLVVDMGPGRPEVTVAGIDENEDDDEAASARLAYDWDVNNDSSPDWSYETTAQLRRGDDDKWLVQWEPSVLFSSLVDGDRLVRTTTPGGRADIVDRNGNPLMGLQPVLRIGINKPDLPEEQQASSAAALANLVGLDPAAYTAAVQGAGPEAFVEALVQRAEADGPATEDGVAAIPGALALPAQRILAPTRSFARALLGTVGEATAELIEDSEGRLSAGDQTGLSGLQKQYDAQLQGSPGIQITVENAAGTNDTVHQQDPQLGTALHTTLDPRLQALAEGILEQEPSASAIVAIQPSTGEILTAANGPGSEGQQTALLGQYPPGSTFKTATALAMLRSGSTPASTVDCPADLTVDGRKFSNVPGYPAAATGAVPLRTAFANSCNTAFLNARDTVSQQSLSAAAADLGIGVEASIGTDAFFGSVPAEAEGTQHAASLIGQGQVLVSPLSMAVAGASIGKGERVSPTLIRQSTGTPVPAEGSASATASPTATESTAPGNLSGEEAASLREMMRAVVAEGGVQMLLGVPGEPVLAKSGTAEFGSQDPPETHAWVLAIQGDLAVAVFVEQGERGSTSGGPLMKAFLEGAQG
ncbi:MULTISPECIES: penicillin-binding transpeptidase domain-containing protein [unclassified Arthrobacter]|uniref:penicillin-binding transpeptidase domain-containing protein n=1 Tax=unclassified Arthrobacter TaxID=235627 RepID=UPI001E4C8236|nr:MULTISPECIES: penicillin-binding transpeptidase domain-containing protein [unclassified Arthrobacter]MCC9144684.1 penicillin-binding protein [Arthrobacter sp. zg-Y919]MDK1275910.1 penicillin-binding transpeptidase domain-containing protein [Arthrobacter sp. zg.Y919]WIB02734.1 penicillin-binding transpeptidase domain-containing protein [Arthrobacter sp. zg-Y919]